MFVWHYISIRKKKVDRHRKSKKAVANMQSIVNTEQMSSHTISQFQILPNRNTNRQNKTQVTMKLITPTLLTLASAPIATHAWNMGGPSYLFFPSASTMMQRQRSLSNQLLRETQFASPRYELIDNNEKFQLSVDVPGVKMEDIDVSLEDGYLTVSGQRMSSSDNSRYSSKFSQTFSLDAAVDVDKFTASLSDGVLVVAAPKDMKRIEANITKIPIMQGKPEETVQDAVNVETASLASDSDEDGAVETVDLDHAEHKEAVSA